MVSVCADISFPPFFSACSPTSRQGSPEQAAKDAAGLEALAQLASPASSSRLHTLGGRSQASALAQLADVEGSSWGPRGASHAPSKYGSFSADLDFDEFLERQQRFLQVCYPTKSFPTPCPTPVTRNDFLLKCGKTNSMCNACSSMCTAPTRLCCSGVFRDTAWSVGARRQHTHSS